MKKISLILALVFSITLTGQVVSVGTYYEVSNSRELTSVRYDLRTYTNVSGNTIVLGLDYVRYKVAYYIGIEQSSEKYAFAIGVHIPNHTREQEFPFGVSVSVSKRFKRFRPTLNTGFVYNSVFANIGVQLKIIQW